MTALTITTITLGTAGYRRAATPKRGIRGAAGGVYIGPVRPNSTSHGGVTASVGGYSGGGAEDTNGFRESDNYDASGGTGGMPGAGGATVTSVTRQAGAGATRTAYIADGVQGGSAVSGTAGAKVIDPTGRAVDSGVDRFGRTRGTAYGVAAAGAGGAGLGTYTYTNFDGRATDSGSRRPLGGSGRGTIASGTGPADAISGETITSVVPPGVVPPTGTAADPASGTIALVGGAGKVSADLHADDITGGSASRSGAEYIVFKRGADTDEDGAFVGRFTADGGTDITDAITGLTAGTYAWYGRFLYPNKSPRRAGTTTLGTAKQGGPFSARATVVVS